MLAAAIIKTDWREPAAVLAAFADEPWAIGLLSGGEDYSGIQGAGFAYSPSLGTNDGIYGPFAIPLNQTGINNEALGIGGWAGRGTSNGAGCLVGNPQNGGVYAWGQSQDGGQTNRLWKYSGITTSPTIALVANGVYGAPAPGAFHSNCTAFPDPKTSGARYAFWNDEINVVTGKAQIWSDVTGTPTLYQITFTSPTYATGAAPDYVWNSTDNVMAVSDGINIWEATITWNGTTYVVGAWTQITASATGDVPTVSTSDYAAALGNMVYLGAPYNAYVFCMGFDCRSFRRH